MAKKTVICHDRDGEKYEVGVDKLKIRVGVYGILIKDDKVLLSKQWDGYDFPGGGIEINESIDEALEREFWEETGLKVKRSEIVACESSFFKSMHGKYLNSILIYYLCEKISGELSVKNIDENEKRYMGMPEWIDLENTAKIKFYNSVNNKKIIKQAKQVLNKG